MTSHLTSHPETIPGTWDDARDGEFFRMVADLFSPSFTAGAGGLLASYDDEDTSTTTAPRCPEARSPLPAAAAAV